MAPMTFGALNFVHNFNFNIYGFYYCFFREQDVIFCHCIFFNSFNLTAQSNSVVINLKYFYRNILESNYNIFNVFTSHDTKGFFFVLNAKGDVKKNYLNIDTFKNKIIKFDMFIGNCFHFDK